MTDDNQEIRQMIENLSEGATEMGSGTLNLPELQSSDFERDRNEIKQRVQELYNDRVARHVSSCIDMGAYDLACSIVNQCRGYEGELEPGQKPNITFESPYIEA